MGERTLEIRSWGTKDGYSTAHVNWLESIDTSETEQEAAECAQKVCLADAYDIPQASSS